MNEDALAYIQQLESTYSQVSKALCCKENATLEEILEAVDQLKSSTSIALSGSEALLRISPNMFKRMEQLESSRWELFAELSTAYYGKQMYGLNDDGTVYSRYSCDTMSFEQAADEFRRLISDE